MLILKHPSILKLISAVIFLLTSFFVLNPTSAQDSNKQSFHIVLIGDALKATNALNISLKIDNPEIAKLDSTKPVLKAEGATLLLSEVDTTKNLITIVWDGQIKNSVAVISLKAIKGSTIGTTSIKVTKVEASGQKDITKDLTIRVNNSEIVNMPFCGLGEIPTSTSPCNCAPGANFNSQGVCVCLDEGPYTKDGCKTIVNPTFPPGSEGIVTLTLTGEDLKKTNALNITLGFSNPGVVKLASSDPIFKAKGATQLLAQTDPNKNIITVIWDGTVSDGIAVIKVKLNQSNVLTSTTISIIKIEAAGGANITNALVSIVNPSTITNSPKTSEDFKVSPNEAIIKVRGVPKGINGLAIEVTVDNFVAKLGTGGKTSVLDALVVTDATSEGVGIISFKKPLPRNFNITVPIEGISSGTSIFSIGNVLDMLGGKVIEGTLAISNVNFITVRGKTLSSEAYTINLSGEKLNEINALNITIAFDKQNVVKLAQGVIFNAHGATQLLSDVDEEKNIVTVVWKDNIKDGKATITGILKPGIAAGTASISVLKIETAGGVDVTNNITAKVNPEVITVTENTLEGGETFDEEINNVPTCVNGELSCVSGTPACISGDKPLCGSDLGFVGGLAGAGCIDEARTFFDSEVVVCSNNAATYTEVQTCDRRVLCPRLRKRFAACREDKTLCKCICPFKIKKQRFTPICNAEGKPACTNGLITSCTDEKNSPQCFDGKLVCTDDENGFIDLTDIVICK